MARQPKPSDPGSDAGRFAYDGLDRVIHEKARLGILTSLAAHPQGLGFNQLKQLCALTDGNLSRHLQILADARLVQMEKGHKDNRPHTQCRISALGRQRLGAYVAVLEKVVADAALARELSATSPVRPGLSGL